jgi:hypothetical protein
LGPNILFIALFSNIHKACHLNKFQNGVYFSCLRNVVLAVIEDR